MTQLKMMAVAVVVHSKKDEEVEKCGCADKEYRQNNRIKAMETIDSLVNEYGELIAVPEENIKLLKVRLWLGAYENRLAVTDVKELRSRMMRLSEKACLTLRNVMYPVAMYVSLTVPQFWRKLQTNTFTVRERRSVWMQICAMERNYGLL